MTKMIDIERKNNGRPIVEVLKELYTLHGSQVEVAKALGISQGTLSVWLIKLNLEQKTILVPRNQQDAARTA